MQTALTYRGSRLTRSVSDVGWIVNGILVPLTWNGALSLVDSRTIGPAPFSLICKECGERELAHYFEKCRKQLIAKVMCFSCDHFDGFLHRQGDRVFAHNGHVYTIGSGKGYMKGFGGRKFKVTWPDGTEIEGNDLWHGGDIPEHFHERFKTRAARLEWL